MATKMPSRLLHERLRDYDEDDAPFELSTGFKFHPSWKQARNLAYEIERFYIPRPRYGDGTPIQWGNPVTDDEILLSVSYDHGGVMGINAESVQPSIELPCDGLVEIPKTMPLDADGVPIKTGDHVYNILGDYHFIVHSIDVSDSKVLVMETFDIGTDPSALTHECPVRDADGKRILEGDRVWTTVRKDEAIVTQVCAKDGTVHVTFLGSDHPQQMKGSDFTHEAPDSFYKFGVDLERTLCENGVSSADAKDWVSRLEHMLVDAGVLGDMETRYFLDAREVD